MNSQKIRRMTLIAIMTAVMCVLGPLSIPIGPVPLSLTTFAVFLSVYILGSKDSAISVVLYLLIGLVGLPVFSGFQGGVFKLLGPTGGYLIGFIPAVILAGILIERFKRKKIASFIAMNAATWLLYVIGSLWLSVSLNMTFTQSLCTGVLPFIVGDIIKIIVSIAVGHAVYAAVRKDGERSHIEDQG